MQFMYLAFYKILSTFATNLVGLFVPLIIYQYTGNIFFAICAFLVDKITAIILTKLFKNFLFKKPQLCLLIRIVPMFLYNIFVMFVSKNVPLFCILIVIFYAFSSTLDGLPSDIVFNYSAPKEKIGKKYSLVVILTQLSLFTSTILGGIIIQNFSEYVVALMSIIIYFVSVIPLLLYYFKNRKNNYFNSELTSNANEKLEPIPLRKAKKKYFIHQIIVNILGFAVNTTYQFTPLFLFIKFNNFSISGTIYGVSCILYALGVYLCGKLDSKKDIKALCSVFIILASLLCLYFPFCNNLIVIAIIICLISFLEPFQYILRFSREIDRSRILGLSNYSLYLSWQLSRFDFLIFLPFSMFFGMYPYFIMVALSGITYGIGLNAFENKSRNILVNVLNNNEIECNNKIMPYFKKRYIPNLVEKCQNVKKIPVSSIISIPKESNLLEIKPSLNGTTSTDQSKTKSANDKKL